MIDARHEFFTLTVVKYWMHKKIENNYVYISINGLIRRQASSPPVASNLIYSSSFLKWETINSFVSEIIAKYRVSNSKIMYYNSQVGNTYVEIAH